MLIYKYKSEIKLFLVQKEGRISYSSLRSKESLAAKTTWLQNKVDLKQNFPLL